MTNTLGWSATTGQVEPWVYQRMSETFVLDDDLRNRLATLNPVASSRMANRLLEASERAIGNPTKKPCQPCNRPLTRWRIRWKGLLQNEDVFMSPLDRRPPDLSGLDGEGSVQVHRIPPPVSKGPRCFRSMARVGLAIHDQLQPVGRFCVAGQTVFADRLRPWAHDDVYVDGSLVPTVIDILKEVDFHPEEPGPKTSSLKAGAV